MRRFLKRRARDPQVTQSGTIATPEPLIISGVNITAFDPDGSVHISPADKCAVVITDNGDGPSVSCGFCDTVLYQGNNIVISDMNIMTSEGRALWHDVHGRIFHECPVEDFVIQEEPELTDVV